MGFPTKGWEFIAERDGSLYYRTPHASTDLDDIANKLRVNVVPWTGKPSTTCLGKPGRLQDSDDLFGNFGTVYVKLDGGKALALTSGSLDTKYGDRDAETVKSVGIDWCANAVWDAPTTGR